ncbi:hypothetical protein GOP47_0030458 [Adiantum capillus-veneris]|nr:hypothetical protein GOP47_0030458 [Adiantum capillus-veneris]
MDFCQKDASTRTALACRSPCSSSTSSELFCVWDVLPDVLVAKIIALLPFSSIYLARGVCKRWRETVWSPMFFSFLKSRPLHMPWLLEFQQHMYNQAWSYDLEGCQWFHLNFSFIPETAMILATSCGLVCLGRVAEEGYVMYVCNPLTKEWKKLPTAPRQPDVVVMDVDRQLHAYTIVGLVTRSAAGSGSSGSVLVYNGVTQSWRETSRVPVNLRAGNLWDATVSGGILYCLSTKQRIEAFDLELGFWSPVRYPNDSLSRILHLQQLRQLQGAPALEHSYICNRKGCLAMITPHHNWRNIFITKLDPVSRTWRSSHISAMIGRITCVGRFSSVSLSMEHEQSHVFLLHPKGNGHYSSVSKSFQQLPPSPISRCKLQTGEILVKGLWFEPRLDVAV